MTYAELKTQIAEYLNRSDLTNQLDTFIKNTEAEVNRKLRHKDMVKRVIANADNQYLQLPGDWLGAINVDLQGTNPSVSLKQLSLESMDDYRTANDDPTGQPVYFAIDGDTMELAPTPSGSYNLQLVYYAEIPPLGPTNTENFLSRTAPDVYLYGALKHASIYLMEDERLPVFAGYFEKAMEELRQQQAKADYHKGSLLLKRRTYGKPKSQVYYYKS